MLASLLPGRYLVTVAKPGFAPISVEIAVRPDQTVSVPVTLEPAGITDLVTVEASVPADATAYKLPATVHETPRSVTIIDSARMREQNLRSVPDALAYVPGMFVNSYRTGGYHFYARGYRMLPEDTRIDGFAGINAGGGFGASLFGVEQAVMLRGPAGLLYGSAGSPGGLINLITKKPLEMRRTQMDVRTGGYAGSGVGLGDRGTGAFDLDSTGPLTRDGRVLYRALFTVENASYFTADVLDQNRYANASVTWKLDRAGPVHPDAHRAVDPHAPSFRRRHRRLAVDVAIDQRRRRWPDQHRRPVAARREPVVRRPPGRDVLDRGGFPRAGFPGADAERLVPIHPVRHRHRSVHAAGDDLRADSGLADLGLVQRVHSKSGNERRYQNVDVNGTYDIRPGGSWKTLMQVGVNGRVATLRATSPVGPTPGPQSALDVYTGECSRRWCRTSRRWPGGTGRRHFWNTYVQNQTSLASGRVVATMGLGYGQNEPAVGAVRTSDLMPNAALVVNATRDLALFGSYATSYNPTDPASETRSASAARSARRWARTWRSARSTTCRAAAPRGASAGSAIRSTTRWCSRVPPTSIPTATAITWKPARVAAGAWNSPPRCGRSTRGS